MLALGNLANITKSHILLKAFGFYVKAHILCEI